MMAHCGARGREGSARPPRPTAVSHVARPYDAGRLARSPSPSRTPPIRVPPRMRILKIVLLMLVVLFVAFMWVAKDSGTLQRDLDDAD